MSIVVPDEYIKYEKQIEKLKAIPQYEQRSKEWFEYRYNRITASDTATAINMNPYECIESFILKKCTKAKPFDNENMFFGKKYEPIATMLYEHIFNVKVDEYGALPSPIYNFLGASPDGICSKSTLDNKFSPKIGTMLEIKCPSKRPIKTTGEIIGGICPYYYYCQVQQQLECCELDNCDFWQCYLTEYIDREEFIKDDCKNSKITVTENNDEKILTIDKNIKKGAILEFYPKNFQEEFIGDKIEWKSKHIYPTRLDMSIEEYNEFILNTLDTYKTTNKDIYDNYIFNRVIYWKINKAHNVTIPRDKVFLDNVIPMLKETWDKVLYYRENRDEIPELEKELEKNKNSNKHYINNKFTIYNRYMTEKSVKFLDTQINTIKLNIEFNK